MISNKLYHLVDESIDLDLTKTDDDSNVDFMDKPLKFYLKKRGGDSTAVKNLFSLVNLDGDMSGCSIKCVFSEESLKKYVESVNGDFEQFDFGKLSSKSEFILINIEIILNIEY